MSESGHRPAGPATCEACGSPTKEQLVSVVLGDVTRLTVVEGIPAAVCTSCGEQYYATETGAAIEKVVKDGFPKGRFIRQLVVPVYSFEDPVLEPTGAAKERQPSK